MCWLSPYIYIFVIISGHIIYLSLVSLVQGLLKEVPDEKKTHINGLVCLTNLFNKNLYLFQNLLSFA